MSLHLQLQRTMMSFNRISGRWGFVSTSNATLRINESCFSTARLTVPRKPSPISHYRPLIFPTKLVPTPISNKKIVENRILKTAFQYLKKKQDEMNNLQWLMDKMKIATLPSTAPNTGSITQHTFQVMNRNARKAKRANHGKRPCSRDRRRWKIKKWANTSRRG